LSYRTFLLLVIVTLSLSCCMPIKELTPEEKIKFENKIEYTKEVIVNPIMGIALSACQYQKTFNNWPNVSFASTQQSNFETFEILSREPHFYSKFKLKSAEYIFSLKVGLPNSKLNIEPPPNYNKELKRIEKIYGKLEEWEKLPPKNVDAINASDCEYVLAIESPEREIMSHINGNIILGETWTTETERRFFTGFFWFITKTIDSNPKHYNTELDNRLFSRSLIAAFVQTSICIVLGIKAGDCK